MAIQYTEEIKKDAVRYWKEHQELGIGRCVKNLGIGKSTLSSWRKAYDENGGNVPTRGNLKVMRRKKSPASGKS